MTDERTSELQDIAAKADTEEGKATVARVQAVNSNGPTPALASLNDVQYQAYATPYLGQSNQNVLTILAQGWYFPTPAIVKLYLESVEGEPSRYRLMQANSIDTFGLATYHVGTWTSGAALVGFGDTIVIEDANGTTTVPVRSWT